ncbi:hypothetical protein [Paraburkholderia phosphatilytica]|uniref:hypothetical protein n=1 Tax=Paraburkholderia phosphatilytica TaxID=2282883 RepID=UPI000E4B0EE8|nr:hypothetical protein [Paraburkholderia phosphatilytica]
MSRAQPWSASSPPAKTLIVFVIAVLLVCTETWWTRARPAPSGALRTQQNLARNDANAAAGRRTGLTGR